MSSCVHSVFFTSSTMLKSNSQKKSGAVSKYSLPLNSPPGPLRSSVADRLTPAYILGWVIDQHYAYEILGLTDQRIGVEHFVQMTMAQTWNLLGHC